MYLEIQFLFKLLKKDSNDKLQRLISACAIKRDTKAGTESSLSPGRSEISQFSAAGDRGWSLCSRRNDNFCFTVTRVMV